MRVVPVVEAPECVGNCCLVVSGKKVMVLIYVCVVFDEMSRYGHLTWEWEEGIRSYLHPMVFALFYKRLALSGLAIPWVLIKAQSIFSAFGDLYLYKLSLVLFGDGVAKWALSSQLANWFMFFCFNHTFPNSLETVLTLVSLYWWPSMRSSLNKVPSGSRKWGVALAALACAIRPTSAITWVLAYLAQRATFFEPRPRRRRPSTG
ncbi:hypothetical protein V6N11_071195 [Hibiscus sabdariffa]|uniref:Mannosyltransferase n=1 Tax=Hibiscus sabdariffa TaxID=183260 RepID=A0ABR2TZF9_9ROSI